MISNWISAVSAKGQLRFMVTPVRTTATVFVEFSRRLVHSQERPVFLIVDNHSKHRVHLVTDFVKETNGQLRLFRLPPCCSPADPDEWVYHHFKNHRVGRQVTTGTAQFQELVLTPSADCRGCPPPSVASSTLPTSATSSDRAAHQRSD